MSKRNPPAPLERFYDEDNEYEICIDEAGRGCLFGRVYIAAVILPKSHDDFDGKDIKDSKKFSSKKKLNTVAEYVKEHARAWYVTSLDEKEIDQINILKAVMNGMHTCIREIAQKMNPDTENYLEKCFALIDGNYFTPVRWFNKTSETIQELPFQTIEQGDGKYMGIAAASILAKTGRDNYIYELCQQYPILDDHYSLSKNVGYGTVAHRNGIAEHGITRWHRKTYGCCKTAVENRISEEHEPL